MRLADPRASRAFSALRASITPLAPYVAELAKKLRSLDCRGLNVERHRVQDKDGFQVEFQAYEPLFGKGQMASSVLILPPTGGVTWLEHRYAKMIAHRGMRAVMLESWTGDYERNLDFGVHDRHLKRSNRAIQLILEKYPNSSFRVLGTSLGSLYGLSALARVDRIEAGVLITCGAPFSRVIGDSLHSNMNHLRDERMTRFKIKSHEEYVSWLDRYVTWNDINLIQQSIAGRKRIFQVLANNDEWVPSRWQYHLRDIIGGGPCLKFEASHIRSILEAHLFYRDMIIDFISSPSSFGGKEIIHGGLHGLRIKA